MAEKSNLKLDPEMLDYLELMQEMGKLEMIDDLHLKEDLDRMAKVPRRAKPAEKGKK